MSIFVDDSDSDTDFNLFPNKRQRLNDDISSGSSDDYATSESELDESDWEDIELPEVPAIPSSTVANQEGPESFVVPLGQPKEDSVRKERLRAIVKEKKRKVAIHNLGLLSYTLHATSRNRLLTSKPAQRALKKLLPDSFMSKVKKAKKAIKNRLHDSDVQLVYVIKYLIKWFRLNYKIVCNGLRVLGYLPPNNDPKSFYPLNAESVDQSSFISKIKRFSHNRDFGAQLFTGLIRCIGFEARLIFSVPVISPKSKILQPKLDPRRLELKNDYDLLYPYFWTEIINPIDESELFVVETCAFHDEEKRFTRVPRYKHSLNSFVHGFYPVQDQFNSMSMMYVIALDQSGHIFDVSSRYMKSISYRWFDRIDLRTDLGRSFLLYCSILRILNKGRSIDSPNILKELECLKYLGLNNYEIPKTRAAIKRNPNFTTRDSLRYDELLDENAQPVASVRIDGKKEPIFFRNEVIVGKSEQQWKFLGRSIIESEKKNYIKLTKALLPRTIARKRMYNLNIQNGIPELNAVKLYSFNQTCSFIKDKVVYNNDVAVLPKNKFGNIEIFKEWMVPDGCAWLQMSHIETILSSKKNSDINYVPVVTGFSFRKKGYAIPKKQGVLVPVEQVKQAKKFWLQVKLEQHQELNRQRSVRGLLTWYALLKRLRLKSRLDKTYNET